MPLNECIPFYEPGKYPTVHANVALTGKRFCAIVANRQSGPGLSATAEGSNLVAGLPTAAGRVFGVVAHDAAIGTKVLCYRGSGLIVPVSAAAAITAFQEVEVNGSGQVVPKSSGVAVGFAVTGAAGGGADAEIALYQ